MAKSAAVKTRNPLGWGYVEDALKPKEVESVGRSFAELNIQAGEGYNLTVPGVKLRKSRVKVPGKLKGIVSTKHEDRLLRAVGRSFRDLAMLREKKKLPAPDAVATPANLKELEKVLEWAYKKKLAVIPFGGGSSVVGGINAEGCGKFDGVVTIDLQKMNTIHEVDTTGRVVHAGAGILGPALDAALKPYGFHARHIPQSYHHSSLGGWVASRGAGHNTTVHAKIEERVQALSGMLVNGKRFDVRPLPATSVAIDPRSYWTGSEGILGIIDSVRLRVYPVPKYRGFRGIGFKDFESAMTAARLIAQTDLYPVQLRLLDQDEYNLTARLAGRETGGGCLMILADESEYDVVENRLDFFLDIALQNGGRVAKDLSNILREWIRFFFRQPYMRDYLLEQSIIIDTFETSIPWAQATGFYHQVKTTTQKAIGSICDHYHVGCRATHVYTDGLCLYYSFYGPGKRGSLLSQWGEIKDAVSRACVDHGGTISHHHAMGRDHRRYAKDEWSKVHEKAVTGLKKTLDPRGQMNPGLW